VPTVAHAEQVLVLKDGIAALKLSSPGPENLASSAAINLKLPSATMNAQATASVGQSDANGGFWHKDAAQVDAQVQGPFGSSFAATGEHQLSFDYRAPAGTSGPTTADHLVRSENQTGNVTVTIPVEGAQVVVGGERSGTLSQDTTGSQAVNPVVGTQDHQAFARVEWQPSPGIEVEGGAAARTANVTWRGTTSRSSSYRSVDPHVSVSLTPWQQASVSAKIEHAVSPYDTAAFASYSTDQPPGAPALEPDHSWQLETRFEQSYGNAKLSASYTASRDGSATEFAQGAGGVQTPASTPLLKRDDVSVNLTVPLAGVGLPGTELSSEAQWRTSRVIDPLTHEARAASGEVPRKYGLRLAHALPGDPLTVGLTGDFTGTRTSYQVQDISTTQSGGSVGAFVSFTPGPYQVDLNVSGLCGSSTTDYVFRSTRLDPQLDRISSQPNSGPMLSLSLHKAL
jgi:hypothetical protein